jgi:hypothetical protein
MSHDRGCPCGKEPYEYRDCKDRTCSRSPMFDPAYARAQRAGTKVSETVTFQPAAQPIVITGHLSGVVVQQGQNASPVIGGDGVRVFNAGTFTASRGLFGTLVVTLPPEAEVTWAKDDELKPRPAPTTTRKRPKGAK